jgi:hypothetical protein
MKTGINQKVENELELKTKCWQVLDRLEEEYSQNSNLKIHKISKEEFALFTKYYGSGSLNGLTCMGLKIESER